MCRVTKKRIAAGVLALATVLSLASCTIQSPAEHGERLRKAAGLKEFHLTTTPTLWEATADRKAGGHGPIDAEGTANGDGLATYILDGVQLANYLRLLDYNAHGAPLSHGARQAESQRMYNEISTVLDKITKRPDPDDDPVGVVVDDAFTGEDAKDS